MDTTLTQSKGSCDSCCCGCGLISLAPSRSWQVLELEPSDSNGNGIKRAALLCAVDTSLVPAAEAFGSSVAHLNACTEGENHNRVAIIGNYVRIDADAAISLLRDILPTIPLMRTAGRPGQDCRRVSR